MMIAVALALFSLLCLALGLGPSWSDETHVARNALVFTDRNQEYGAYRLRTDYGQRLGVAFASTVGVLGAVVLLQWGMARLGSQVVSDPVDPPHVEGVIRDVFYPPIAPPTPKKETNNAVLPPTKPNKGVGAVEATDSAVDPIIPPVDTLDVASSAGTGTGTTAGTGTDPGAGTGTGTNTGTSLGVDSVWKDFQVQERPIFPGGENAMVAWVERHLDFPADLNGRDVVYVQFTVGLDGNVEDVRAVKGAQAGCRNAAERTVRRMPRWTPAKMNGHDVRCRLTLPIHFETR